MKFTSTSQVIISLLVTMTTSATGTPAAYTGFGQPPTPMCDRYDYDDLDITEIKAKAKDHKKLQKKFTLFQSFLGDVNNGSGPAQEPNGFRSINWDAPVVPFDMPGDFFSQRVDRGMIVSSFSNEFRVSNPVTDDSNDIEDDKFDSINEAASQDFQTFSPLRLFTPVHQDNQIEITFTVPDTIPFQEPVGRKVPASVNGFGAIFSDVDEKDTTGMIFYDRYGCELYRAFADKKNEGLSFVGVSFGEDNNIVAKVVIILGNVAIDDYQWEQCAQRRRSRRRAAQNKGVRGKSRGAITDGLEVNKNEEEEQRKLKKSKKNDDEEDCGLDVVVLDDFTYGEPVAWHS